MKKITFSLLGLAVGLITNAQSPQNELPAQLKKHDGTPSRTHTAPAEPGSEMVIWSEDFASGIPATWTNTGFDGNQQPLAAAVWEYRGPSTTPNASVGSRGAFAAANDPILSPSTSNGFVIFDSDFLDNAGNATNPGGGTAPAPHIGTLTTNEINLSSNADVMLEISSYTRVFFANMQIALSSDGGTTWTDTILVHSDGMLGVNGNNDNGEILRYNVSNAIGGSSNARLRFIFDGRPGNANGNAYYFWCLDDIKISELPSHSLEFVESADGAPEQDIIYGGTSGEGKFGIMTLKQARPISFDANILNFGSSAQSNVKLEVTVLDDNDNIVQQLSSPLVSTLGRDSVVDYTVINTSSWTPSTIGTYRLVYAAMSDSVNGAVATIPRDTFTIFVTDSLMSLDFNRFDNRFGTDDIGDDGSAIASRFDIVQDERLFGVDIWLSATTVAGGVIEVTVFDSTGFDFQNGFPAQPLAYAQHTVTAQDVASRNINVRLRTVDGHPIYLDATNTGAYYIVVTLFSNAGANPVNLRNSQTFPQPSQSSIMYYTISNPRWYTGFTGSLDLNAPHIRAIMCPASNAAACMEVSIDEVDNQNSIRVYPNPASEYVNIDLGEINGEVNLSLVDIQGRVIYNQSEKVASGSELPVSVAELKPGMYVLNIAHRDRMSSFKLTVQ